MLVVDAPCCALQLDWRFERMLYLSWAGPPHTTRTSCDALKRNSCGEGGKGNALLLLLAAALG